MLLFISFGLLATHHRAAATSYFLAGEEALPDLAERSTITGIVCYGFNGLAYTNNTICPNSNSCCGVGGTCLSNRLCHNPHDSDSTYVRGPCAIRGWDPDCAQVCLYNETEYGKNVLPRVTVCSDGSFCCNANPQCCQDGTGTFLDVDGSIINSAVTTAAVTSYPPVSNGGTSRYTATPSPSSAATSTSTTSRTLSPTSNTTPPSSTRTSSTPSATSSSTAVSSGSIDAKNLKIGLGVGLGVGIPVSATAIGFAVFFVLRSFYRQRAQAGKYTTDLQSQPLRNTEVKIAEPILADAGYIQQHPVELHDVPVTITHELDGGNADLGSYHRWPI